MGEEQRFTLNRHDLDYRIVIEDNEDAKKYPICEENIGAIVDLLNTLENRKQFYQARNNKYLDLLLAICNKQGKTITQLGYKYGVDMGEVITLDKSFTTVETGELNQWWIWHNGKPLRTYEVCTILLEQKELIKLDEELLTEKTTSYNILKTQKELLIKALNYNNINIEEIMADTDLEVWNELNELDL